MPQRHSKEAGTLRIGQAAEALGVSVGTLRRWGEAGRIKVRRTRGGQRVVALAEVERLRGEGRPKARPVVARSARNRFEGVVTRIERDRVAAIVELLAGPHRIVGLVTREAVDELGLKVGMEAVAVVKATNVMIDLPSTRMRP